MKMILVLGCLLLSSRLQTIFFSQELVLFLLGRVSKGNTLRDGVRLSAYFWVLLRALRFLPAAPGWLLIPLHEGCYYSRPDSCDQDLRVIHPIFSRGAVQCYSSCHGNDHLRTSLSILSSPTCHVLATESCYSQKVHYTFSPLDSKEINSECSLEGLMWKLKLQYFGHLRLIGKDPDAGKDWRQKEKGAAEDEMVG